LSVLPLPLDAYYGYDSLATFVGTAATPVDADVARVSPVNEVFSGTAKNATLVAIFVPADKAGEVSAVLFRAWFFRDICSQARGNVDAAIATLEAALNLWTAEMAPLKKKLADMKKQYEDLMLATDEYLSMQTRKTEAPLRFAETANAFVMTAMSERINSAGLKSRTGKRCRRPA